MVYKSNIGCYLFHIVSDLSGMPENFLALEIVQQHFQFWHIAHVTLHFYQVPLYPLYRNQQDWYELGAGFPKCFVDFASFIGIEADVLASSKNEIFLWGS